MVHRHPIGELEITADVVDNLLPDRLGLIDVAHFHFDCRYLIAQTEQPLRRRKGNIDPRAVQIVQARFEEATHGERPIARHCPQRSERGLDADDLHLVALRNPERLRKFLTENDRVFTKILQTPIDHVRRERGQRALELGDDSLEDDAVRLLVAIDDRLRRHIAPAQIFRKRPPDKLAIVPGIERLVRLRRHPRELDQIAVVALPVLQQSPAPPNVCERPL